MIQTVRVSMQAYTVWPNAVKHCENEIVLTYDGQRSFEIPDIYLKYWHVYHSSKKTPYQWKLALQAIPDAKFSSNIFKFKIRFYYNLRLCHIIWKRWLAKLIKNFSISYVGVTISYIGLIISYVGLTYPLHRTYHHLRRTYHRTKT